MTDYRVTGSCLCGGVKFEITKPPADVHYCHCQLCRKTIGADFATDGAVPIEHFKFIKDGSLKEYQSSANGVRVFCGDCGCTILAKGHKDGVLADMKYYMVFFGALDSDPAVEAQYHIFAKYKAPWDKINDTLPQSEEGELLDFSKFM